jgi:hypothetical protein
VLQLVYLLCLSKCPLQLRGPRPIQQRDAVDAEVILTNSLRTTFANCRMYSMYSNVYGSVCGGGGSRKDASPQPMLCLTQYFTPVNISRTIGEYRIRVRARRALPHSRGPGPRFVLTQEAKYVEGCPNTTSAWAGCSRFDILVDRYGGVHPLLICTSSPLGFPTCHHRASQQDNTY